MIAVAGPINAKNYSWLDTLSPLPRMIVEARKLLGTKELSGAPNNPVIMAWATECGTDVKKVYTADSVPWCGLFMAVVAKRAGKTPPTGPLWALNWGKFGEPAGHPGLGDVLTFIRPEGGHVALYIGEDQTTYHVLGGNQTDQVCFTRMDKTRLRAARRPLYMSMPTTVKPYIVEAKGGISTNEN